MLAACTHFDIPYEWSWTYDNTRRIFPNATDPEQVPLAENVTAWVDHHGTHGSYERLINGTTDLILVARLPSEDELTLAEDRGVELEARPVALDAFIFIVNVDCQVYNFTTEEIRGIYTGGITNWSELGGPDFDINPYTRDPNSGSQVLMETLVMDGLEMMDAPDLMVHGMMGPINVLSWDDLGIGYSVYYFEQFMAPNANLRLCAVDGYLPTPENISSRAYAYTTEVYVVIRADEPEGSPARELRDWFLSEEGQVVVAESGYVPISAA